jgi:hypothetical protein
VRYLPDGAGKKYEKGVGPAKKWGISISYYPQSSKIIVYQPISTKFHMKVAFGTSHITIVELPGKGVRQLRKWRKKSGKITFFDTPEL